MIDKSIATKDQQEQNSREILEEQEATKILQSVGKYFIEYDQQLYQEFKSTTWKDNLKREEIYRQSKSLDTVIAKITRAVQTGGMARETLTYWQKLSIKLKK